MLEIVHPATLAYEVTSERKRQQERTSLSKKDFSVQGVSTGPVRRNCGPAICSAK